MNSSSAPKHRVDPLSSSETLAKSYYHRQKSNGSKGSVCSWPAPLSCYTHTTSESHNLVVASSKGITRGRHFLATGSANLDIVWQEAIKSLSILPSSLHGEGNSSPLLSIILHCVAVSGRHRVIKGHHFFPISFLHKCGESPCLLRLRLIFDILSYLLLHMLVH